MATIYIETHGCQMNEADSQYIVRRATSAGYTLAERAEDASVLVLNTCTVRDNAEKRAYGRLQHWKAIKSADPSVRVVVAGCLAEQDRDRDDRQWILPGQERDQDAGEAIPRRKVGVGSTLHRGDLAHAVVLDADPIRHLVFASHPDHLSRCRRSVRAFACIAPTATFMRR